MDIAGNLTIGSTDSTHSHAFNAVSASIKIGGNLINNDVFEIGTSTVVFNGTADQSITTNASSMTFYDLVLDKPAGTARLSGVSKVIDVNSAAIFSRGTFSAGSNTINVAGDWTINPTTATFAAGGSTVNFDGSQPQRIVSNAAAYNDIVVSNSTTVTFLDPFTAADLANTTPSSTMRFAGGEIYTITGALNINGQSEDTPINITSTDLNRFVIDNESGGDLSASYVNVSYSEVLDTSDGNIIATDSVPGRQTDRNETQFPRWVFAGYNDQTVLFLGIHF
jgi:hypothetical protein